MRILHGIDALRLAVGSIDNFENVEEE